MDVMLQNHRAKHICDVPDGLRELCADISREVIRSQPDDLCCFIAEYLDSLLITRENAKVAMKLVQHVVLRSEHIMDILGSTGLKLEEIAAAAPRLQKAFRAYLEAVDAQKEECGCDGEEIYDIEDECESTIGKILKETGATREEADAAATKIQALFRGHFERLWLAQQRGEVRWQRAVVTTMEILRKLGITQTEATHAAIIIQSAYRGYYARKTLKISRRVSTKEFNLTAWLKMMFEITGLTLERANEAATIIQSAYRRHLQRKHPADEIKSELHDSHAIDLDKIATSSVVSSSDVKSDETVGSLDSDTSLDLELRATKSLKHHEGSGATLTVASTVVDEAEKQQLQEHHPESAKVPEAEVHRAETPKEGHETRSLKSEAASENAEARSEAEPRANEAARDEEKSTATGKHEDGKSEDARHDDGKSGDVKHDDEKSGDVRHDDGKSGDVSQSGDVRHDDGKSEDVKQDDGKSEVAKHDDGKSEVAKHDDGKSEVAKHDDGKSEVAKQDDKSEAGKPDDEKSEA